mgnify:CR=1 FL=1
MKKMYLSIIFLLSITGCQAPRNQGHLTTDVSWRQEGKDCVYKESEGGIRREWNFEKDKEEDWQYISAVKTIKYANTSCEKVIDAELKNKTHKSAIPNHFHEINSISNKISVSNTEMFQSIQ